MTSGLPNYVNFMVGADASIMGMRKKDLGIAFALGMSVIVVITKVNMSPPRILERTMYQVEKVL